ncbi:MAG: TrmH family RNA methyltransferase, partial [Eubacteriales bacterium]
MTTKESEKFADSGLMEGITSLRAVISGAEQGINDRKIEKVLFDAEKKKSKSRELAFLTEKSKKYGFPIEFTSAEKIDSLTIGNSHGGIIAFTSGRTIQSVSNMNIKEDGFYVFLQGIEDPYNFGYALRSLYAAGVSGVILEKRNWMSASGVVCRASAGASELFELACGEAEDIVNIRS